MALSADGRQLAYTMITYRDDGIEAATEVLVRDLATGAACFRAGRELHCVSCGSAFWWRTIDD